MSLGKSCTVTYFIHNALPVSLALALGLFSLPSYLLQKEFQLNAQSGRLFIRAVLKKEVKDLILLEYPNPYLDLVFYLLTRCPVSDISRYDIFQSVIGQCSCV